MSLAPPSIASSPGPGRYELLGRLASGGMATVHLGRAHALGGFRRIVAIKVCHPHLADDDEFVAMFLDEARLAARIHHPNVVPTLDVARDAALYLVMEYVEGEQLSGLIKAAGAREERVPVAIALRIACDALAGLHAAHQLCDAHGRSLGVVHRDVSPQNVMVGADGISRILDFGVARAASRASVTREGHVRGKAGYMPPEQLSGLEVTARADVYAAGVVLWETLAGRRLFRSESDAETAQLVLRGVVPRLRGEIAGVTEALDATIARALATVPAARFATAAAFAEALEQAGVALASTREVAAYVERAVAPLLAARRAMVREIDAGDAPASTVAIAPKAIAHDEFVQATGAIDSQTATTLAPASARRSGAAIAVLGACAVLATAGLAMRLRAKPVAAPSAVIAPPAPRSPSVAPVAPVVASSVVPSASPVTAAPMALWAPAIRRVPRRSARTRPPPRPRRSHEVRRPYQPSGV